MFNNEMMLMGGYSTPYTIYKLTIGTSPNNPTHMGYSSYYYGDFGDLKPQTVIAQNGTTCYIKMLVISTDTINDRILCIIQDSDGEDGEYYGDFYIINIHSKVGFLSKAENGGASENLISYANRMKFFLNPYNFYISETPPPFDWTDIDDRTQSGGTS